MKLPQGTVGDPYPHTALGLCCVCENEAARCSSQVLIVGNALSS